VAQRVRSVVFSSLADMICVSGPITGQPVDGSDLAAATGAAGEVPVFANTGVNLDNVERILAVADDCVVGTHFKSDGHTWSKGSYDWIAHRLTGTHSLERNWALEAGFLEIGAAAPAGDLVALGGITPACLSPLRDAHDVVGHVTPKAAHATGLAAGTPVVAGCADHVASAFVAGVTAPGDLLIKFGGAGDILLATPAPVTDPRLFLNHHLVPGLYLPNGCMASSGAVLNWIIGAWGATAVEEAQAAGTTPHALLDARAAAVPPGAEGLLLLPYFLGEKTPLHDPHARGTLVGLGLHHSLAHVWRAALEAVCFGFRHYVEVLTGIGQPVVNVIASDGGAASGL
jgi:xylulokinase